MKATESINERARFAVGLSTAAAAAEAAAEACASVRSGLEGRPATLAVIFASPHLCRDAEALLAAVHRELAPVNLVGCTGEAIIAEGREVEDGPALSLWGAYLPDVEVTAFPLVVADAGEGRGLVGWPEDLVGERAPEAPIILLADPFTFPADGLLGALNAGGGVEVVGGLASGGRGPGQHRLFLQRQVMNGGAVAVGLRGARMVSVVSQGCAPVGPDMVITAGGGHTVEELAGRPAGVKLAEVVQQLPEEERELARDLLLAGLVIDENRPDYERGDFLVRGIHLHDPRGEALMVGEEVRVGQTLRLHVRDADSADEDLRLALRRAAGEAGGGRPAGALVFSCNGRGTRMFDVADHDASVVREELHDIPAAGFFCNGEIGPVGGKSFLHGFTATLAVFLA